MNPLRGEVWWVRLDPTLGAEIAKTRPCVVITNNLVNQRRRTIVIIPISSSAKPSPPLSIAVICAGRAGAAVVDQVRAAAKERFISRMGVLSQDEMAEIEDGLRRVLELE